MGRKTTDLEGELLSQNALDLGRELRCVVLGPKKHFEARSPPVVHRAWRVEAEHVRAGPHSPRRVAQLAKVRRDDRRDGFLIEDPTQLQTGHERGVTCHVWMCPQVVRYRPLGLEERTTFFIERIVEPRRRTSA